MELHLLYLAQCFCWLSALFCWALVSDTRKTLNKQLSLCLKLLLHYTISKTQTFNSMSSIGKLMKQAARMQQPMEQIQADLAKRTP